MIRTSILIILTTFSFQLYAKETNYFPVSSNNIRLEKLELGVAELGAERERAREIRQGTHNDTETGHNTINLNNKTTQSISNTKQLELGVAELGAKRERARAISQEIHHNAKTGHKINNPDYKATRIISNKERLEKLERRVSELGAERKRARAQIQDRK